MKPETGGNGFNPEAQSNRYAQIPDLVRRSISGFQDTRRARRAQVRLFSMINSDRYFDPVLIALAEAQQALLKAKGKGEQATTIEFVKGIFSAGINQRETENEQRQELVLRTDGQAIQTLDNIISNDKRIQRITSLQQNLPNNYILIVDSIPSLKHDLQSAKERNIKEIVISLVGHDIKSASEFEEVRQQGNRYNEWLNSLSNVTVNEGTKDEIIDTIKKEPDCVGQEKLFIRKFAEVSLQDLEAMEYPLSEENFEKITTYLTEALSDGKLNFTEVRSIQSLFFIPTFFQKPASGPIEYRNRKLLANLNSWQELFADAIVFGKNPKIDEQLRNLLQHIKDGNVISLSILTSSLSAVQMDPDSIIIDFQRLHILRPRHPILSKVVEAHLQLNQKGDSRFVYAEEIVVPFVKEIIQPLLERRLEDFGVGEKFQDGMNSIRKFIDEYDFSSDHLNLIKDVFERNSGSEFLEKIKLHTEDIQKVTRSVWENLFGDLHFLPMQEGVNILEFSKESVPSILGLKSIKMIRAGSDQNWNINVIFVWQNSPFQLIANLNQDGKLEFRSPIEQEIPGFYTMLNHIAVLTFHDLVVQERKEREVGSREPKSELNGKPENGNKAKGDTPDRTYSRDLPRVQQDRKLVADVYEATNREPRRVELHDRFLPGAREYQAAVDLYQEAVTSHVSEDAMHWAIKELGEARKKAFRISQEKRLNAPAKFQLLAIQDPVTGEVRYLKTWVVEHSNPKPTPEELKSPVKLYERYYKNSSALASLDQMKPWFIGQ